MGNIFTNESVSPADVVQLSNGSTSVFVILILLSGSSLANSEWEIEFLIWFAQENDQSIHGIGMVGVDIADIGWTHENFKKEKNFVLNVIENIFNLNNLDVLDYEPQVKYIEDKIIEFREFVRVFTEDQIPKPSVRDFYKPINNNYNKCERHGIYLYSEGCYICNDR